METEYKRCPYCRESIAMELLDGNRLEKAAFKANKQAMDAHSKKNRNSESVAGRLGAAQNGDVLHDRTNINRSLAFIQSLAENQKHRSIAWMIIHNDIPRDYKELFDLAQYSLGTRFSFEPVNYTGSAKSHVLDAVWYWAFRDAYLKRRKMRSGKDSSSMPHLQIIRNRVEGMDRMELRFRDKELKTDKYVLALALTPVCPYCRRLLPNVFPDITDDPLSINLIGDPKVGKTVWQTALLYYLIKNKNTPLSHDCYLTVPEPLDSFLAERMENFSRGIIPNQTAREAIEERNLRKNPMPVGNRSQPMSPIDIFKQATQESTAAPADAFSFSQQETQGSGTQDNRPIPFLFILNKNENGKIRRRFVNICDFPGENLALHIEGVNNTDLYRTADALFLFADLCTSETGLASVNSFVENSLSHALPHLALIIPKADKGAFLQQLVKASEKEFCETLSRILRFHLTKPTCTVQSNALSQLCSRLAAQYLHCSAEDLAGYIINRFSHLLLHSSLVRYTVAPEDAPNDVTLQDVIATVCEDAALQERFCPTDGSFWLAGIAENRLFTHNERPMQGTGCEVRFDEAENMLRQYYLRRIFPDADINTAACNKNARDLSVFPVSALGMEAFEEGAVLRFDAQNWDPVNLTEPLYWFLSKIYK